MKETIVAFLFLGLLVFTACEPPYEGKLSDKENHADSTPYVFSTPIHPYCWFNENTLQQEVVRTKPWASKMDENWEYSYGFRGFFSDFNGAVPKSININLWAFWPEMGQETMLVVAIDSLDTNVFWTGLDLKDSVKTANEWQSISFTIAIPEKTRPEDRLGVFVWSYDKKLMYVDDLTVGFSY